MASEDQSSTPQLIDPESLLTDCPECQHTICRSCVYDVLKELDLPGDQVKTRSSCSECSKKEAICACGECQKIYCGACYVAHRKMCVSKNLLDEDQPKGSSSASPCVGQSSSAASTSSHLARNESCGASSNSTPDPQLGEDASGDDDREAAWKECHEWMKTEIRKLQLEYKDKKPDRPDVKEILSMGQQVLEKIEKQEQPVKPSPEQLPVGQQLLEKTEKQKQPIKPSPEQLLEKTEKQKQPVKPSLEQLPNFDVVECPAPGTFIVKDADSNTMYQVKMETLEQRIKRNLCEGRASDALNTLEKIRDQLQEMKGSQS